MPGFKRRQTRIYFGSFIAGVAILVFHRYLRTSQVPHRYFIVDNVTFGQPHVEEFDDAWVTINSQLFIYSAYYDIRAGDNSLEQVQIMAFQDESFQRTMYCSLHYSNATFCSEQPAQRSFFRTYESSYPKEHYYRPTMYSCVLPNARVPSAITIVNEKACNNNITRIPRKTTKVHYDIWFRTKEFGVCVHSPLFEVRDHQFVAAYVEMNRLLGAEWFSFYIYSASNIVRRLLRIYQDDGLVEVAENWGKNDIPRVRYSGQDLSIQDCLYRNMYRVKYLVYTDLDELIYPSKHPNWHQMMKELDDGEISAFYFRHVALFNNTNDTETTKLQEAYGRCAPGDSLKLLQIPRFLSYSIRSPIISYRKDRRKLVIKPLAIRTLRIHWVLAFVEERDKSVFVDVNMGSTLHFRSHGLDKFQKRTFRFDKFKRLAPKLFSNLQRRLCGFD